MGDWATTVTSWIQTLVLTGGALTVGLIGMIYVYQEKLLYFPSMPGVSKLTTENPEGYRVPSEYGIDYEDVFVTCSDGVKIHSWLMKQPSRQSLPTIVFFHGNAGNIGYRLPNAAKMFRHLDCNILLVDYRGFGLSDGVPTEEGLQIDADGVIDYLHTRSDIDPTKIVIFGRSLGGAVAIYLAESRPTKIAGLIVENTFLSISSMVDQVMPWLTYIKPIVLAIDWNNERRIRGITLPILFVAGERDELVPHSHMQKLHALATKSSLRKWLPVPRGTHNDSWLRGGLDYFHTLRQFIATATRDFTLGASETCDVDVDEKSASAIPNMLNQPLFNHLPKDKDA
ncbi:Alpha/beta hydrolase domain-containing protein 13 [Aphanomyces cochlioides]|nr:Alpha/beta hydrolase domain-containing protein 13 [Aphanomyces cochlioides]